MDSVIAFFMGLAFTVGVMLGWYHPKTITDLPIIPPSPKETETRTTSSTLTVQESITASSSAVSTSTIDTSTTSVPVQ